MKFSLIDHVLEQSPDRVRAVKHVTASEEYLADHFPGFPVLPGVMMIETLVQAARVMLSDRGDGPLVLGRVRALKYGSFVHPGETLDVEVTLTGTTDEGYMCKATGRRREPTSAGDTADGDSADRSETAVSGRFIMRAVRRPEPAAAALDA